MKADFSKNKRTSRWRDTKPSTAIAYADRTNVFEYAVGLVLFSYKLLILALSCSFGLLLALYAGLLVVLSLTKLCKNAGLCALSLETTKRTVKSLVVLNSDFCHLFPLPSLCKEIKSHIFYYIIIYETNSFVKGFF